ncbi:MAG: CHAP domain-containing protein [Rhodococcus sp. (in: high G+C Gram-positive bacteria)]|nr:CHAP domain-containing protein [Rhodococcus sp. (in: high G+C Gram-positive bacteria)]
MRPTRVVATSALSIVASLAVIAPMSSAQAAPSHYNTDPYKTGCSRSSYTLASRAVSGGTARIKVSRSCGTNWVEYSGKKQTVSKRTKDHRSNKWTRTEVDNLPWSYSLQSYAPGATKLTAEVKIGSTTTTATCASTCSWKSSTSNPAPKPPSTSLSARVDAFVRQYNGRYVDFDRAFGAQCLDLVQFYNRDVVRARFMATPYSMGAKDTWRTYDTSRYTKVSASSKPRKGDVAIWGSVYGGQYGHIAIVLADEGKGVKVLTQNPGATRATTLRKAGLLGYIRPRS